MKQVVLNPPFTHKQLAHIIICVFVNISLNTLLMIYLDLTNPQEIT